MAAGVAPSLEVTDAQARLARARESSVTALYRHKATEFRAKLPDGSPTPEFRLWCQKLAHLTPEQFRELM